MPLPESPRGVCPVLMATQNGAGSGPKYATHEMFACLGVVDSHNLEKGRQMQTFGGVKKRAVKTTPGGSDRCRLLIHGVFQTLSASARNW